MVRSWPIKMEFLKTNSTSSTSQAPKNAKNIFMQLQDLSTCPKIKLMAPLNNHMQNMFVGCIDVSLLYSCKEQILQYSQREFY